MSPGAGPARARALRARPGATGSQKLRGEDARPSRAREAFRWRGRWAPAPGRVRTSGPGAGVRADSELESLGAGRRSGAGNPGAEARNRPAECRPLRGRSRPRAECRGLAWDKPAASDEGTDSSGAGPRAEAPGRGMAGSAGACIPVSCVEAVRSSWGHRGVHDDARGRVMGRVPLAGGGR